MWDMISEGSSEIKLIVDYVHRVRRDHGITPGPSARGLESDEYGEMGQFVNVELVRSPDFTGPWKELSDQGYRERAASFVQGEIAHHERKLRERSARA